MVVTTTLGDIPEAHLRKHAAVIETDDQRIETVEYCLVGCPGVAHVTGQAQRVDCFCPEHVHRSLSVVVKRFPEGESVGFTQTLM